MVQLQPLDRNVPIFQQLQTDQSPVILINFFASPRRICQRC